MPPPRTTLRSSTRGTPVARRKKEEQLKGRRSHRIQISNRTDDDGTSFESPGGDILPSFERWENILDLYGGFLHRYKAEQPARFEAMIQSKQLVTDQHVVTCLKYFDRCDGRFEEDVLFAVRYVWSIAMVDLPRHEDKQLNKLRDPSVLLAEFSRRADQETLYKEVGEWKMRLLKQMGLFRDSHASP